MLAELFDFVFRGLQDLHDAWKLFDDYQSRLDIDPIPKHHAVAHMVNRQWADQYVRVYYRLSTIYFPSLLAIDLLYAVRQEPCHW